tara:strand:- start:2964 stop:3344 length:381 start_codon:yes stop_codon:yes gene_type:complete
MSLDIVPVQHEHIMRLWGKPIPKSIRGLSVMDGDTVLGVTGVYLEEGCYVLVSRIAPEGRALLNSRRHVKTLLTAARQILAIAAEKKLPVRAVPEPGIYGSENLLRHLGFRPLYKDVWTWQIPSPG